MSRQEQLQLRKQRQREESVSTFPESYKRANGDPDSSNVDEILGEIAEILSENKDETRKALGHLGIEAA